MVTKTRKLCNFFVVTVLQLDIIFVEVPMIKKENGKYYLKTKDGTKNLGGPYTTEEQAVKREKQVNYFKHQDEIKKKKK